jgi:hypothetical protein
LGYPLADVWGFVHHKQCQCCGYWKVYENKREKESLFKQFDCCRKEFILLYEQGYSLLQILNQADNQPFRIIELEVNQVIILVFYFI